MTHGAACLIKGPKSQYQFVHDYRHPEMKPDEVLIQVEAIGLNPIGMHDSGLFGNGLMTQIGNPMYMASPYIVIHG